MGTPIINLDNLIDLRVDANVNAQAVISAESTVLGSVAAAQAVYDSIAIETANSVNTITILTTTKEGELDTHTTAKIGEITSHTTTKISDYDSNATNRVSQYNDNADTKLTEYNDNNTLKLSQYNDNSVVKTETLNITYAQRIIDMLNTKRILGAADHYVVDIATSQITFLSTNDANYLYYVNGIQLIENVDYTVLNDTTLNLTTAVYPDDVVVQINTQLFGDYMAIAGFLDESQKGQPNGVAELDGSGLVPSSQLPSYVDDVIEVANYAALPVTGEGAKIYVVVADENEGGKTSSYRWTGTAYALVSNTLTAADVKALYESNANTNEFTDAEKTKVGNISVTSPIDLDEFTYALKTGTVVATEGQTVVNFATVFDVNAAIFIYVNGVLLDSSEYSIVPATGVLTLDISVTPLRLNDTISYVSLNNIAVVGGIPAGDQAKLDAIDILGDGNSFLANDGTYKAAGGGGGGSLTKIVDAVISQGNQVDIALGDTSGFTKLTILLQNVRTSLTSGTSRLYLYLLSGGSLITFGTDNSVHVSTDSVNVFENNTSNSLYFPAGLKNLYSTDQLNTKLEVVQDGAKVHLYGDSTYVHSGNTLGGTSQITARDGNALSVSTVRLKCSNASASTAFNGRILVFGS